VLKYWVRSKNQELHFIPTDTVYVTIDKEAVRKSGMLMASDSIPDKMAISLKGKNALYKGDLMMLEMIANCNWTRPIYVAITVGQENYMNLGDNFIQEGLANRITPFTTNKPGAKNFDTDKVYKNMMTRFKYGGLKEKGLYLDETVTRMCFTHRRLFGQLISHLISEGKTDQAKKALAYCEQEIPPYNVPLTYMSGAHDLAKAYAMLGMQAKAKEYVSAVYENARQYAAYYSSFTGSTLQGYQNEAMMQFYIMNNCIDVADMVDPSLADKFYKQLENLTKIYQANGGQLMQLE
jgi:hypothetical protein